MWKLCQIFQNGSYHYYERDYLGSVRLVVNECGDIEQATDYCVGGLPSTRLATGNVDRRHHTGKELLTFHGVSLYYNQARWYDPILCRFSTPDPLAEQYPDLSPYSHCANNPLTIIDPDGMRIRVQDGDKIYFYHDDNDGEWGFYEENSGNLYDGNNRFIISLTNALNEISTESIGKEIINELVLSDNEFTIERSSENKFKALSQRRAAANLEEVIEAFGDTRGSNGSGGTIYWNPSLREGGITIRGTNFQEPYVGLFHEMAHGSDANKGLLYYSEDQFSYIGKKDGLKKSEWRAVYQENIFRFQKGLPLREYYGIDGSGPGCHMRGYGPRLLDDYNNPINYPPY